MSDNLFFLFVKIILSSLLLFFRLNSKLFSLHFLNFLVSNVFLSFIIHTDPFKLLNFIRNFIHLNLRRAEVINFSIWNWGVEDIINLSPFITFSSINNDKGLSWTSSSGSTTCSVNVSITIQRNSILDNISNEKIKTSCSYICWDQNVYVLWFFKSLQFCKTHFLFHVRVKIWCFESQGLKEKLNSSWNFYCIGKNYCFWLGW